MFIMFSSYLCFPPGSSVRLEGFLPSLKLLETFYERAFHVYDDKYVGGWFELFLNGHLPGFSEVRMLISV